MSSARPRTRALRVGVVLSDTVIAEHVVRSGTAFTIGQSIRNLVPLPIAGLPRRWQLLELVEHGVLLRLAPGMGARVSVGGVILGRSDLDQRGAATRAATLVTIPSGCHGKIDLGEVKVLFQELAMPAPAPAPALPRAVKGTLADRIDRRMAGFAAASLLLHFGIMTAATVHDGPGDSTPAERALSQYTADTVTIIDADDPLLAEPATDPEPANPAKDNEPPVTAPAAAKPVPTSPAHEPRPSQGKRPQPVASDPGELQDEAERLAGELFSSDTGGTRFGDIDKRAPGTDLEKQLKEIADGDAQVAVGKPVKDRLPSDGKPRIGTSTNPNLPDGVPGVTVPADDDKIEKGPPARIDIIKKPPPVPGADISAVIEKIRTTYMTGLERCYKKILGPQPGLTGKVSLTFTVTEKGKLEGGGAKGVDEGFEKCVEGLMTRWSFSPVLDEDGDPIEIDLEVTLQLSI